MSVWAYDLDGVLAQGPPPPSKPWSRMRGPERKAYQEGLVAHYLVAPQLYHPETAVQYVITARRHTDPIRDATYMWFERTQGYIPAIYFLEQARTYEAVVSHKASKLVGLAHEQGVTDFVEDNVKVLQGLRRWPVPQTLWLYKDGTLAAFV